MLSEWIEPNVKINFDESWNSEHNLEQLSRYPNDRYFTCASLYPYEKRATYVAVTGPGTVWTETNNGRLDNSDKTWANMIIIIETSEPKNYWPEPGDDVSPDDVIRLYQADPGLLKNSKKTFFTKGHWPKYFIRADGSCGTFEQIKNVDELRNLLIVPNGSLNVQNTSTP